MTVTVLDVSAETRVNDLSLGSGGINLVGMVMLADGDYLAFQQGPNFSAFKTLYVRRFSADGSAEGPSVALDGKFQVKAAATADGGYVLTWRTGTPLNSDVMVQKFDAGGAAVGSAVSVGAPGAFVQGAASVAVLSDGGYAVAWQTRVGINEQVALQRFDAAGAKVGDQTRIAGAPQGSAYSPTIDALPGGGYVVGWSDTGLNNLFFQVYDAAGGVVASGTHRGLDQDFAALPGGGFITAWSAPAFAPGADYAVYTQTYNAAGAALGGPVRIESFPSSDARNVSVVASADGGYQVTWLNEPGNVPATVVSRRFDASGDPIGDVSAISTAFTQLAIMPLSAALAGGGYLIMYGAVDGDVLEIYQQRITPAGGTVLTSGVQLASGDGADDTFLAPPGSLQPGDHIAGEDGVDTLLLTAPGTLDFTGVILSSVERITGSAGNDTLVFSEAPAAGTVFATGGGSDVLQLAGAVDLRTITLQGDWTVRVGSGQSTLILGDASQIPRIDAGSGVLTIDASHLNLTEAERAQLFSQGVSQIVTDDLRFLDADTAVLGDTPILMSRVGAQHGEQVQGAALAGGGYVQVWTVSNGGSSIHVQAFNADGSRVGPGAVLADGAVTPISPTRVPGEVIALADGGYVVTWTQKFVFTQRFDATHVAQGPIVQIGGGGNPYSSGVFGLTGASLDGGGYVLAWGSTVDGTNSVRAQRFSDAGAAVGSEIVINASSGVTDVVALDGGGFVVGWIATTLGVQKLVTQRFDAAGQKVGAETVVGSNIDMYGDQVMLLAVDDGYAAFYSSLIDRKHYLSLKLYDAAGALVTTRANIMVGEATWTHAVVLSNGDLLLAWSTTGDGAYLQRFSAAGEQVGEAQLISAAPTTLSNLTALPDGGFVASYNAGGRLVHQVFSEYAVHTLTSGVDTVAADTVNTLLDVAPGDLSAGDVLSGGSGRDVIQLAAAGALQLDAPASLAGFEELRGSAGDDQISGSAARLASFAKIDGGAGSDSLILTSAGTVELAGVVNVERFVGSAGDDVVILAADGPPAGMVFESNGGRDTLVVTGTVNLANLNLEGSWAVTAAAGEAATLRMTSLTQLSLAHGENALITVDARTLNLTSAQRAQLFSQGVDFIVQAGAVFTPTGGLSLLEPAVQTQGDLLNVFSQPYSPVVTSLPGGYVAIWRFDNDGAVSSDLRGQFFDMAGDKVGSAFLINTTTTGVQASPSVTTLAAGGFVVTWTGPDASGSGIYAQRFDTSGARLGGEVLVNTDTAGNQAHSTVIPLNSGFAVSWVSGAEVRVQRFDANGVAVGAETSVRSGVDAYAKPAAAALADGGFVISWVEAAPNSYGRAYVQRYDAAGAAVGQAVAVPDPGHSIQRTPSVAGLADGGYLVVWANSPVQDPLDQYGAYLQRYDAAGAAVGERVLVGTTGTVDTTAVTVLADGGYLVAWGNQNTRSGFVQRFNADGQAIGGEIELVGSSGQYPYVAGLSALGDGFVASWTQGYSVSRLFAPLDFRTLTSSADVVAANAADLWLVGAPGALGAQDSLSGGAGTDVFEQHGAGTIDLTAPATFEGFERLMGSEGDDIWRVSADRLAGVTSIALGDGVDQIVLASPGVISFAGIALTGVELILGSAGDDTITGSPGNDLIDGGPGADILIGGSGFGGGIDTVTYASATAGVTVDLRKVGVAQDTGGGGVDTLSGFSHLTGSGHDDILIGTTASNILRGGLGSDVLYGLAGNDTLYDGGETSNRDFLYGGRGNDTYYVTSSLTGPLDLVYEGGTNPDIMGAVNDIDVIHSQGEFFWDYYSVGEILYIDNVIAGGAYLVGGQRGQTIWGSAGTDLISVYGGSNRVDAGAGTDAISFSLYGLDESFDGVNTLVMKPGSGSDYVYEFESGVDKIDLTAFGFGITGQQVLDQAVNVDQPGTADDYCYFYLTGAGGVDNYIVFMGLLSSQLQAADFITGSA